MNHTSTLRRGTAAVLAGALLLSFAGCADNQTNEGTDIPMENLAYGATLREDTSHDFTIEYDKRFLEQDELDLLFSYYDSIQKQDVTEFTSCIVDFYLDYIIENMYGGLLQSDAYLTKVHDAFQTVTSRSPIFRSRTVRMKILPLPAWTISRICSTPCRGRTTGRPTSGTARR